MKILLYLSPLVAARIANIGKAYCLCVPHALQSAVADLKHLADLPAGEIFLLRTCLFFTTAPCILTKAAISLICSVSSLKAELSIVMISIRFLHLFAAKVRQRNLSGTVLTRYYREIFIEFVSECPSKATQATRFPCFYPSHNILIYLCAR